MGLRDGDGACGAPGALLFEHDLDLDGLGGQVVWRGADISPPIALTAGHSYFIFTGSGSLTTTGITCSVVSGGTDVREYTHDQRGNAGPWAGPFTGSWTARVIGACK